MMQQFAISLPLRNAMLTWPTTTTKTMKRRWRIGARAQLPYRTKLLPLPLLCNVLFSHSQFTYTKQRKVFVCVCGIECTSWVALQLPSTKEKAATQTPALTATERRLTAKRRQCFIFLCDCVSATKLRCCCCWKVCARCPLLITTTKRREAQQKQRCVDKSTQTNDTQRKCSCVCVCMENSRKQNKLKELKT